VEPYASTPTPSPPLGERARARPSLSQWSLASRSGEGGSGTCVGCIILSSLLLESLPSARFVEGFLAAGTLAMMERGLVVGTTLRGAPRPQTGFSMAMRDYAALRSVSAA